MNRSEDWLKQALRDFDHAQESKKIKHFEWVTLAAQQAAEKAIKAVFFKMGGDPWGHALTQLLQKLPSDIQPPEEILNASKFLDKHYITTRYPNGFSAGAPEDYYTEQDADEAIANAKKIIEFCQNQISAISKKA